MDNFPQPPIDPPQYPLCRWCDGSTEVAVDAIIDVNGKPQDITDYTRHQEIVVKCPRCDATGLEPGQSEDDNPNIP